jgi:hypothetical protein
MAKRKYGWTENKIARYYKEGRGSGELSSYKPWLTIQDVPSTGRSHRPQGWKTSRMHELMSDLERDCFYILEWDDNVIDIREQYPLDREKTLQIAEKKQIKHSVDSSTQTPIVMTTDFLITIRENNSIRYAIKTVKPSVELNDKRTIQKLETEREYWESSGIEWGIVTELDLPRGLCENIGWIHRYHELEDNLLDLSFMLFQDLKESPETVLKGINSFDEKYSCEKGTALSLFKYLIAQKYIKIDMNHRFDIQTPIDQLLFTANENNFKERLMS